MTPPRKPRLPADTRLSWRDPDLPVFGKSGNPIPHHKMQIRSQISMQCPDHPNWRQDPTYHLRKDKPKP